MSGIYVHIPFCKKACHYCNFHFSTNLQLQSDIIEAICREIELQKDYLQNKNIDSIYFGGGTPSLLKANEIHAILNTISKHFKINDHAEITLEANPDDLALEKLHELKQEGINRLSIGIQSFFDSDLEWMNRSHNTLQSHQCLESAFQVGFNNLSIDLIFGSPTTNLDQWKKNLEIAMQYKINHLSCYGLTVEEGTALKHFITTGKTQAPNEENALEQFEYTMTFLKQSGYDHYEISNYCLPDQEAVHNSNYWKQEEYLGIGPSAHSFDEKSRQWNVNNNVKYLQSITEGTLPFEKETLNDRDRFNEYLMTGLRTKWGCHNSKLKDINSDAFHDFQGKLSELISEGNIFENNERFFLTEKAKPIADNIISELFITD